MGDRVLQSVARHLSDVRGEDAAFRLSGDGFAVIFATVGLSGSRIAMRRLEAAIKGDEDCPRLSLSYGVAELQGGDPASLIAAAGHQLLRIKRTRARRPVMAE